jgi:S1-C subfamily serine protease
MPLYNYADMFSAERAESIPGRARIGGFSRPAFFLRLLFLALLAFSSLSLLAGAQQSPRTTSAASSGVLRELDDAMENLSDRVGPSVVQIQVSSYGPREEEDLAPQEFVYQHAIGSGIIVDGDGYIMTNNHVVAGAQHVRVVLPANSSAGIGRHNRIYDAEILGTDPESDLALVKINAHRLPVIALDSARKVRQ